LEVYYCGLLAPVLQLQQLGPEGDVKTRSLSDVAVFAFLLSIFPFHKVSPTSIVVANCGDCRCVLSPDYFETYSVSISEF
jgi:serine/threonine protein phosphatase PrpC